MNCLNIIRITKIIYSNSKSMEGNKEIDNIEYNEILKLLTVELINNKWHFLNNDYITNIKKKIII